MCPKNDSATAVTRRGPAFILVMAVGLACAPAARGDAKVSLTLSSTTAYANSPLSVGIKIENAQEHEQPMFPDLADCTVQYVGPSQVHSVSIVNGRRQSVETVTYNYQVTPHKAGPLTIPGIPVHVDGKMLVTKPAVVKVLEIPESPAPQSSTNNRASGGVEERLLAEITCDEKQLYVGQQARFMLTIWVKAAAYEGRLLSSSDMIGMVTCSLGPFDNKRSMSDSINRRLDDGTTAVYYVIVLPAEVDIKQPGEVTFDEVSVSIDYPLRFSRNRSFGVFGGTRVVASDPIRIRPRVVSPEVLPLPEENRPDNFNGLVGRYEINAFATPTNVRVGDPIQLVIDVTGDPITGAPGPDLASNAELTESFRVPGETLAGAMIESGVKRFTQIIRAQRPDVKYIPAIEYPYFNPDLGEYVVAKSEPIPVMVSVTEELDAADLTNISAEPPQSAETQLDARDGLRGNKTDLDALLTTAPVPTSAHLYLAIGAAPAAFICLLGLVALRRGCNDVAARRRRAALPKAERRIKAALRADIPVRQFHAEIEAVLSEYLADRLNEPAARFLGDAAVAYLTQRDVREDLVRLWSETRDRCEQAAYAGGGERDAALAEAALRCLRELTEVRL